MRTFTNFTHHHVAKSVLRSLLLQSNATSNSIFASNGATSRSLHTNIKGSSGFPKLETPCRSLALRGSARKRHCMQQISIRRNFITCIHRTLKLEKFSSLPKRQRQLRHSLEPPNSKPSTHEMSLVEPTRPGDLITGQEIADPKKSEKSNKRAPLTHFLAFPLYTPDSAHQLEASLGRFKGAVSRPDIQHENDEHGPDPERQNEGKTETKALGKDGASDVNHDPTTSQAANPHQSNNASSTDASNTPFPSTQSSTLSPQIPRRTLRPASTLHFTLGVMSLPTSSLLQSATSLLESLSLPRSTVLSSPPIIDLISLSPLPPNAPARCTALYISPSPLVPLQTLGTAIRDRFIDAGLIVAEPKRKELLLHATVMNTIYASGGRRGKSTGQQKGDGKKGGSRRRGRGE